MKPNLEALLDLRTKTHAVYSEAHRLADREDIDPRVKLIVEETEAALYAACADLCLKIDDLMNPIVAPRKEGK